MKRIFLLLAGVSALLAASVAAFIWYAMAHAAMDMIKNNALYLRQQIQLRQYQLDFDYDRLEIGSSFLSPKITMEKPSFTLTNARGTYYIRMPKVGFVSSFNQYHKFEVVPYGNIVIEKKKDQTVYVVTPSDFPELYINSVPLEQASTIEDNGLYFFSDYKLRFPKAISLQVEKGDTTSAPLYFDTGHLSSVQWETVHYDYYPLLNAMVQMVERAGNGKRSLDKLL